MVCRSVCTVSLEDFKGGELLVSGVICVFIGRWIGRNKSLCFFIETLLGDEDDTLKASSFCSSEFILEYENTTKLLPLQADTGKHIQCSGKPQSKMGTQSDGEVRRGLFI